MIMIQLEEQLLNFNNKNNEMQICYRGVHKIICHHSSLAKKKYWGDPIHSTPEMSNDVSYHEQSQSLKTKLSTNGNKAISKMSKNAILTKSYFKTYMNLCAQIKIGISSIKILMQN